MIQLVFEQLPKLTRSRLSRALHAPADSPIRITSCALPEHCVILEVQDTSAKSKRFLNQIRVGEFEVRMESRLY